MRRCSILTLVAMVLVLGLPAAAGAVTPDPVRIKDPAITESSGLLARDGEFYTVNDSGGRGVVFVIDARTGRTTRTIDFSDGPRDVEALAFGRADDELWVGDIGDNDRVRPGISVTRISTETEEQTRYRLGYPTEAVDAEALLVNPTNGRLYVASKEILGGTLYAAPAQLRRRAVNRLTPVADVGSVVTDGSFFPDGRHVILRGYLRATVYAFPSMTSVGTFSLPREKQGEGIAVSDSGRVFVSSEGKDQPILPVTLPARVRAALAGRTPDKGLRGTVTKARDQALDETSWLPGGLWTTGGLVLVVLLGAGWLVARRRRAGS
ncbi:conserved exported hypothetical protein [metagenome]|uniref:Integral membrane protein n=1 Tax=metagenome TaxID=256318 RepID=A0A2P2C636_9ZZZZ